MAFDFANPISLNDCILALISGNVWFEFPVPYKI